jgi:hypothetical protein
MRLYVTTFEDFFWWSKPPTNFYAASIYVHWVIPSIHAQPYARGRASWFFWAKNGIQARLIPSPHYAKNTTYA